MKKAQRKTTNTVNLSDPVITVRVPGHLLDDIDATAKACGRTRSSEIRLRLTTSLERLPKITSYADRT